MNFTWQNIFHTNKGLEVVNFEQVFTHIVENSLAPLCKLFLQCIFIAFYSLQSFQTNLFFRVWCFAFDRTTQVYHLVSVLFLIGWTHNEDKFPANIYFFKVNNGNTTKRCEMCSKLTIKTPLVIKIRLVNPLTPGVHKKSYILKVGLSPSQKFPFFASMKALKKWWKMFFVSS